MSEPMVTQGIPVVRCWCCPPGVAFFVGAGNPCTWPKCLNADSPDPNGSDQGADGD